MKAERKHKVFVPIRVTFETQEEIDKFYALCNFRPLSDVIDLDGWLEQIQEFHTDGYNKFHDKLSEKF